jgi:hypothetical protein
MALRSFGVDVFAKDIDLASETVKYITGEESWEKRPKAKREWTTSLAEEAAKQFKEASNDHDVVIGDAPGRITEITRIISREASHSIICCRYDCKNEIGEWQVLFGSLKKELIVIVTSKLSGTGSMSVNGIIRATVIGLNRKPKSDGIVRAIAWQIKLRLKI